MPRTVSCAETRCLPRPVARQAIKKAYPAVTSSPAAGMGLDWLSQMISACNGGCYADYINLVSAISPVSSASLSLQYYHSANHSTGMGKITVFLDENRVLI